MRTLNLKLGKRLQQELAIWRVGALPGLMTIGLIVFLRSIGALQPVEWWALDALLRLRPPEATDEQILIVGINEKDIQATGTYPIPDAQLAELMVKLEASQPNVIGLDIIRDRPVPPGHSRLAQVFQTYPNIIGSDQALFDETGTTILPPPDLPPDRVGFADLVLDSDGALRRALIATPTQSVGYRYSFPLLLANRYLSSLGFVAVNGTRDYEAIRFGTTEFDRFHANSGGYVRADDRGNQILINYRSGTLPFRVVSLTDVLRGTVPRDWIRDRIVLIGMTATSAGDLQQTSTGNPSRSGRVYGVIAQAHITSQMVNAVLQRRPWLKTWPDPVEYGWIMAWGIVGISLGRFFVTPLKILLGLGTASLMLVGISYGALVAGWWLAVVPALFGLVLNGAGLTASLFYRYQQDLQARLQDRRLTIEQIHTTIHNIPVQTLKSILRRVREKEIHPQDFCSDLERLESELTAIENSVWQETRTQSHDLYLCGGQTLDLHDPIHQLLYEVYRVTLSRTQDFPLFASVIRIVSFEAMNSDRLTLQQKQGLCRFMEESLCNAGKYARGMTRIEVSCKTTNTWNMIRIADNGVGLDPPSHDTAGYGTRQAKNLARQLGGTFKRYAHSPTGTVCELTYPVVQSWFWPFPTAR
jgi:CHASE2 domain-containing sensor protein